MWLVSVFGFNPANELMDVELLPLWSEAGVLDHSVAMRVRRTASTDFFVVADARNPTGGSASRSMSSRVQRAGALDSTWRVGEIETDAHMLFYRADLAGDVSRVAMVDGSLVRSSGRTKFLLVAPREVPDLHVDLGREHDDFAAGKQARLSGPVFGVRVEFGGRDLPIAVERRSTARLRDQMIKER
jgi:hypothetical protein